MIKVTVTLVIEMDDEQVKLYADYAELPESTTAQGIAKDVRNFACMVAQDAFDRTAGGAEVSIRERRQ